MKFDEILKQDRWNPQDEDASRRRIEEQQRRDAEHRRQEEQKRREEQPKNPQPWER